MSFSEKLLKYGRNPSAHDIVKAVAILSMISDHSGLFLFGDDNWYRILGRVGGPLFFFAIGNSLNTNVTWRLFLWGLWLTGLSAFVLGSLHLNILLSFLLCRLLFQYWKPENASASLHALLLLLFLPLTIPTNSIFEYGTVGLNWAIAGRLVRTNSP
ncbi:MAG: hypothetical protein KDD70_06335, partial [Bdellovibrionales bacterium]|nr:hypothetical protein [Bdellovibrionales bacterium]